MGVAYTYDSLNRLTNVDYGNGSVISYTYDSAGNRLTYSAVVSGDTTPPIIAIISPITGTAYTNSTATINLSGTASDNVGVTLVTWQNYSGGLGVATGTNSWSITGIPLKPGANVISVTAWDAAGNSTPATLSVAFVLPPPPPPQLTDIAVSTGGMFQFNLNGPVGSNYVIQASSNMVNWTSISTNTIPAGGSVPIAQPISSDQPCQFYRAVLIGGPTKTSRITDLVAYVNPAGASVLSWTAPTPAIGRTLEEYDLRLSTNAINTLNWSNQLRMVVDPTGPPGSTEVLTVTNLVPQTYYYTAVKTKDSGGSWSTMSNLALWRTGDQGQ